MKRCKKVCVPVLLAALLAALLCPGALATRAVETATANYRGIRILVNGTQINPCDADGNGVEPFIIDGSTYLPVRAVANALGLTVGWDGPSSTVTLTQGGETNYGQGTPLSTNGAKTVPLVYRDIKLVIDGEAVVPTDAAGKTVEPFIIDDTTYLPVRAVAGALGLDVGWDDASSTVTLDTPEPVEPVLLLTQETSETRTGTGFATNTYKTMTTYQYDSLGNCTEKVLYSPDGTVTATYAYDQAGQLVRETSTENNAVITYAYSDSGLLLHQKQTGDRGGVEYTYTYDAEDRVTKYSETHTAANGRVLDDTVAVTYTYDEDSGRLLETVSTWRNRSTGELLEYDETGRIVRRTLKENDRSEVWALSYDKAGNLLAERCTDAGKQRSYTYDADGNQTSCVYVHDGIIDTTVYTYKNGRMSTCVYAGSDGASETREWTYSPEGELLRESYSNSGKDISYEISYTRSADGRQLRSTETHVDGSTRTELSTYDEYGHVIAREIDAPGLWERYTYEYTEQ